MSDETAVVCSEPGISVCTSVEVCEIIGSIPLGSCVSGWIAAEELSAVFSALVGSDTGINATDKSNQSIRLPILCMYPLSVTFVSLF